MAMLRLKVFSDESDLAGDLIRSFQSSQRQDWPYSYWLHERMLPGDVIDQLDALPNPQTFNFGGKRENNNGKRVFFDAANQERFPVCKRIVDAFKEPRVIAAIGEMAGIDLSNGRLRVEYCEDGNGFWLEPHVDVSAKLISTIIYTSDDPALADAGTDIYDATPAHNLVATAPYARGKGMTFVPADNTWHGFAKRPIRGVRKSLIVNYVSPAWRATGELA